MRTEFAKLLKQVRRTYPDADETLVRKAYRVADRAHQGQTRLSGDPYITHSLAVASVLAGLGMDVRTVSAGLLHDVLEDTQITHEELKSEFGEDIAQLVDGVTKIGTLHIPASTAVSEADELKQAENLRKMLVATAQDVRVILIKLADRLHNMRTIEFLPEHKIERISQETLDIYAPIANRLGLSHWQWELEDHAFHHLHPETYKKVARAVAMKRKEREKLLNTMIQFLEERLQEAEASARVIGRPKHLYSIYQKMERQGKTFNEVLDVLAVRIIAQTVSGCYNALGVVHHLWPPERGRFKDYIAVPKLNMYQSIHTTVRLEGGKPLEVQIRTEEMDRASREGIAAHWKYKERVDRADPKAETQLHWLRQMFDWLKDANAPDELFESVRRDISTMAVYVYTPKGEVKELPQGATPLDFAYMIHTDIGDTCIGAKVNGSMVPLRYHLQHGDTVEILTSKNQQPHIDWLDVVVTGRARTRIRQTLRELEESPSAVGPGESRSIAPPHIAKPKQRSKGPDTREEMIRVSGASGMAMQFAKCCNPMPGQGVIGYVTKRHSVTIHRADCKLLDKADRGAQRLIAASWEGEELPEMGLRVTIGSRPNGLADITSAIRPMNIDITHAEYRPGDNGESVFEFFFHAADRNRFERVEKSLRQVPGVRGVEPVAREELAEVL
ncbi:MAG: bifunctional (p)ppGpp synthetase/guanosine-3',5'-bis(diphosphate) 3'-pyrophosphohydrolase [Candidatus Hydrogenedentes bacterium]|nr:bifunctional (p)ppGpp synthetase/guanosine-3',5'-bis(diphosphate) 3'-pyrophosphohydrolase [Candidatus Hydrogenedentota bacterium]